MENKSIYDLNDFGSNKEALNYDDLETTRITRYLFDFFIKIISFGQKIRICALLKNEDFEKWVDKVVIVGGWVKIIRVHGGGQFGFLELNDGSTVKHLQVIVHSNIKNFLTIIDQGAGACVRIKGTIKPSKGHRQKVFIDN